MDEQRLDNLRALKAEIRYRTKEIENWPQGIVTDYYYDYPNGQKRVKPLLGVADCSGLKRKLQGKIEALEREINAIEDYLATIPDPEMRAILCMRYRYGLTHQQIGEEIGYERSVISRKIKQFFDSCTQNTLKP